MRTRVSAALTALRTGALPPGALSVAAGLAINGVTAYIYLGIARRSLGADLYSPLAALWALTFVAAPGLFLPLEQEAARALASRRVAGIGGRPVLQRAGLVGAGLVAAILLVMGVAHGPVVDRLFDGQGLLLLGFALAIASYSGYYLARGALSGNGRFAAYGRLLVVEGLVRVVMVVGFALAGVTSAGVFSLAIGLPCLLALLPVLRGERDLARQGPPAAWSEVSSALTQLLMASLLAQALLNIVPLAVKVIATDDTAAAGRVLNGLIVARVPLFFFQAIQASLLPRLAAQAAAGEIVEFRRGLRRLLQLLAALVVVSVLGMAVLGPPVVQLVFHDSNALSRGDLALLAFGSEMMMPAFALAQACIALGGYGRAALGWAAGCTVVLALLLVLPGSILRAELAFCAGVAVAVAALAFLLARRLGSAAPVSA